MSEFFIRRPVATILFAIGILVAGLMALRSLPVASLPQVDYPTITVTAQLPGASPQTMADSVATPLIKQLHTIAGVDEITARNTIGNTQVVIQFDLNRDINAAAADVQAAMSVAATNLPPDMPSPPAYRKVNPANTPILLLDVHSRALSPSAVDSLAENVIAPALSTIDGVAQAQVYGAETYAVRVDVDPAKLEARGLGLEQVQQAVAAANNMAPLGSVETNSQTLVINASTQLTNADDFRQLIIANPNGNPVRLGDVATVTDRVQNLDSGAWYDGQQSVVLAIMRQPDANTVGVIEAIKDRLPAIVAAMPAGLWVDITNDYSIPIGAAVHDVAGTLVVVVGLVMLVIYLFIGRLLATLIPGIAVPVCLIAACAGMYVLGYSVDNMSLLALTLAVGLVVDDAIVVFENIMRHVEEGKKPLEAAIVGSREVTSTVVSMSLSLVAIFIPILLMGGVLGRLFSEFGMVVVLAIAASAVVSLTITPMLASRLPRPAPRNSDGGAVSGWFTRWFARLTAGYDRGVGWCLDHRGLVLLVFAGSVMASYALFMTLPTAFFPPEDLDQLSISTQARPDISYDDMLKLQQQAAAVVEASPAVDHVTSSIGGYSGTQGPSNGQMFVQLKPKKHRQPMREVQSGLRAALAKVPGLRSFIVAPQSLRFGGRSSLSTYQLVVQSLDQNKGAAWAAKLADAMRADPNVFIDVNTDAEQTALQAVLTVDQARASALGVSAAALRSALNAGFGGGPSATIQEGIGTYYVVVEYDRSKPWSDTLLSSLKVHGAGGALVPLSSFASITRSPSPVAVNQTGQLVSTTVSFNLPSNAALGTATEAVDALKRQIAFPSDVTTSFGGTAEIFLHSMQDEWVLVIAAIVTIYVILGALYESFAQPLTILSGLPAAAFGALLALKLFGFDLSVIAVIGILMLIGIAKKNAIMMIDVALVLQREEGLSPAEAIRRACVRRFCPILMTTFCALLGTLPIALGTGASSELRQPLGVAVVGGLLTSQFLTLFITPVIFVEIDRISAFTRGVLAGRVRFGRARAVRELPIPAE